MNENGNIVRCPTERSEQFFLRTPGTKITPLSLPPTAWHPLSVFIPRGADASGGMEFFLKPLSVRLPLAARFVMAQACFSLTPGKFRGQEP